MTTQKIHTTVFDFFGGGIIPATGSADSGRLVQKITAAAGTPTIAPAGGAAVLTLEATNEVQNLCLYADDDLSFDIDDIVQFRAWLKVATALGAAATWTCGLASARNDAPGSMTALALFSGGSTNAVSVETDDNVTDTAAVATGHSLLTTDWRKLVIDFSKGVHSQSPPSLSLGGKNAVQFFMENAKGLLVRVAESTRFNMGGYSSGLQPFVQLQKTASTNVGALAVARIEIDHKVPA